MVPARFHCFTASRLAEDPASGISWGPFYNPGELSELNNLCIFMKETLIAFTIHCLGRAQGISLKKNPDGSQFLFFLRMFVDAIW